MRVLSFTLSAFGDQIDAGQGRKSGVGGDMGAQANLILMLIFLFILLFLFFFLPGDFGGVERAGGRC